MTEPAASTHEISVMLRGLSITVKGMSTQEVLDVFEKVAEKVAKFNPPEKHAIDQFVH